MSRPEPCGTWQYAQRVCRPSDARVRVEKALLRDKHERSRRVPPSCDRALAGCNFIQRAAEVQRAGGAACRRAPRHRLGERVIDLENTRRMTKALQSFAITRRQLIAGDAGKLPAGRVKQHRARLWELREIFDPAIRFNFAPEFAQAGGERIRDRLRAAPRQRPADRVASRAQHEPERRRAAGLRVAERNAPPLPAKSARAGVFLETELSPSSGAEARPAFAEAAPGQSGCRGRCSIGCRNSPAQIFPSRAPMAALTRTRPVPSSPNESTGFLQVRDADRPRWPSSSGCDQRDRRLDPFQAVARRAAASGKTAN